MIAIVLEIRACTPTVFPNGLDLSRQPDDMPYSLVEKQGYIILGWIGTSIVFVAGESIALMTVFEGKPHWFFGHLVFIALMELTVFAALIPAAQFFVSWKSKEREPDT